MNALYLFSMGFLVPNLELHLLELGLSHTLASLGFTLLTTSYFVSCLILQHINFNIKSQISIFIGALILGLAYFLIGLAQLLPSSIYIVGFSLVAFGLGQALIFRKSLFSEYLSSYAEGCKQRLWVP
jgi:VIT1/CCC1 family predicted Fe2+/Mn2+ transporter